MFLEKRLLLKEADALNTSRLSTELTPQVNTLSTELTPYTSPLSTELRTVPSELLNLPSDLKQELESLGLRTSPDNAKYLILRLCQVKPFKLTRIGLFIEEKCPLCKASLYYAFDQSR